MRLLKRLVRLGPGFVGQALTFAALLMPVVAGQLDAVALLVGVSAAGNIAAWSSTLVFVGIYPSITDSTQARVALGASLSSLLLLATVIGTAAFIFSLVLPILSGPTALVAVFTIGQGLYFLALGTLIRQGNAQRISRFRFAYGLFLAAYTAVACTLFAQHPVALTLATAFALLTSGVWCVFSDIRRSQILLVGAARSTIRERFVYIRSRWKAIVGGFVSTVGLQGASLAVVGLGPLAPAWAVIIRVAGGFGTVGQNVLGPLVQAPLAQAVRAGNARSMRRVNSYGITIGLVLAILAIFCTVFLLLVGDAYRGLDEYQTAIISVIGAVYVLTTVLVSPVSNNLLLLGLESHALVLAAVRLFAVAAAFLVVLPEFRLGIFALAEAVVQISYIVVSRSYIRRAAQARHRASKSDRAVARVH